MNACTLYNTTECVREDRAPKRKRRPSAGICARCSSFIDSGKPRVEIKAKGKPIDSAFVMICLGKQLKWTVAAWERIAACDLVGTQYKVPRELFEELKGLRT